MSRRELVQGGRKLGRVVCCLLCTTIVPVLCSDGSAAGLSAVEATKERTGRLQKAFADDGEVKLEIAVKKGGEEAGMGMGMRSGV